MFLKNRSSHMIIKRFMSHINEKLYDLAWVLEVYVVAIVLCAVHGQFGSFTSGEEFSMIKLFHRSVIFLLYICSTVRITITSICLCFFDHHTDH